MRSGGNLILVGLVLPDLVEKQHEVLEWTTARVGFLAGGRDLQTRVIGVGLLQLLGLSLSLIWSGLLF